VFARRDIGASRVEEQLLRVTGIGPTSMPPGRLGPLRSAPLARGVDNSLFDTAERAIDLADVNSDRPEAGRIRIGCRRLANLFDNGIPSRNRELPP
jgi:hypothetical protein